MNTPPRLPQWLLEKIALGELPKALPKSTQARLEESPPTEETLQQLRQEDEAFLRAHPPEAFVRRVERKQAALRPTVSPKVWGLALVAAMGALLVVFIPDREDTQIKGLQPGLSVFRKGASGPELLANGAHVHPGDVLQLSYHAAGRPHGMILSVDGSGNVTVHSSALQPSGEAALPQAYRLDAAPRFERFFLVTSNRPLEVEAVVASARNWASAGFPESGFALPPGAGLSSVLLVKDNL